MLDRSRLVRPLVSIALVASAVAMPRGAAAQVKPAKPMQYIGAGLTTLSANGNSSSGINVTYGTALTKLYMTVAGTYFSESSTLDDEAQVYYLVKNGAEPGQRSHSGVGLGGGIWLPQSGSPFMMLSVAAFGAKPGSHLSGHFMGGYILPKSGSQGTLAVRVGLAYTWH